MWCETCVSLQTRTSAFQYFGCLCYVKYNLMLSIVMIVIIAIDTHGNCNTQKHSAKMYKMREKILSIKKCSES